MRSDADPENTAQERLRREVAELVAMLADGELTASHPFDLSTSNALAANIDDGATAETLFQVTAARTPAYRVSIEQMSGPFTRSVISTTVGSQRLLIALLGTLLDELEQHQHPC